MINIIFRFDTHQGQNITVRIFLQLYKLILLSALFILISISILVAGGFLAAFLWSVRNGQFDDDYTPSIRILFEDEIKKTSTSSTSKTITKTK
jgi:cbb3-type cytochrome oxidase maturation protein